MGPDSATRLPFVPSAPRRGRGGAPLFRQVADDLAGQVAGGSLAPGTQLPPEPALAQAYGVNRLTVREAIGVLVGQGLVRRVHGVGSFVAAAPVRRRVQTLHLDLSESLRRNGADVQHEMLGLAAADGPEAVPGGGFAAFPGPVVRLRIRRRVDGSPWSHTLAWVPASLLYPDPRLRPATSLADLLLERHGLEVRPAGRTLTASPADDDDAEHLDVAAGAPLVVVSGDDVDSRGRRLAHVVERIPGDRVEVTVR